MIIERTGMVGYIYIVFAIGEGGGSGAVGKAACLESRRSRIRPPLCFFSLTRKDSVFDREVECSASDRHGSNFESCV